MTTVIDDLARSRLARDVELCLFDTKKTTVEDRSLLEAIRVRIALWIGWWRALDAKPTIAHVHTCSGLSYFLDSAFIAIARLRGVPVVMHVHGACFDQFLDSLGVLKGATARWMARRASCVIVLSEEWRQKLHSRLPGARLLIVENGIVVHPPVPRRKRDSGRLRILFLGNLGRRKGIWEILDAVSALPDNYTLALVGGEEDAGIGKQIHERLKQLGVAERVELPGPVYGEAKQGWLEASDIFVLPSHAEGLPMSLLEAMAAGLPVVTTPVGGIPSVIRHEENGILVPAGDAPALREALCRLIADPSLRERLGIAARALVEQRYGVDRAAAQLVDIYRGLGA